MGLAGGEVITESVSDGGSVLDRLKVFGRWFRPDYRDHLGCLLLALWGAETGIKLTPPGLKLISRVALQGDSTAFQTQEYDDGINESRTEEERKRKSFDTALSIGADWRLAGEMAWGALAKCAARKQAIKEAQPPCETLSILPLPLIWFVCSPDSCWRFLEACNYVRQ